MEKETKKLFRSAMLNSVLLAIIFAVQTAANFYAGSIFAGLIALMATLFVAKDTVNFYNVQKEK